MPEGLGFCQVSESGGSSLPFTSGASLISSSWVSIPMPEGLGFCQVSDSGANTLILDAHDIAATRRESGLCLCLTHLLLWNEMLSESSFGISPV